MTRTAPLRLPAVLALAAIVLAGCSDAAEAPTALQPDAPAFSMGNGPPSSSGPYVIRFEGTATFYIVDPTTGVGAYFGADIVALCSGDPTAFDPVMIQDVNVPEDANRINEVIHGNDVTVSLWDPAPTSCLEVLAGSPATGTGSFVSTDNDLLTFLNPDSKNANAFGVQGHARVQSAAGEWYGVTAISRCVWDGNDGATLRCMDKVVIR